MRISLFLRPVLFAAVLLSPAMLSAQFQQPTDEELKMTTDPMAPGAAAVYLYREETTDDLLHFQTFHERIKVLTEKGKELATIHIPYQRTSFKVSAIKGRTIHSDGTVIPLSAKPSDLTEFKTKDVQFNQIVFTLPSAEVGSILEYSLQIHYSDNIVSSPDWEIQQPYLVHKAHYFFKPSAGSILDERGDALDHLMFTAIGFPEDSVHHDAQGNYFLDLSDIPAVPNDDWMPPLNTLKWRVNFYYTYARSAQDFWNTEARLWAKNVERFTHPSSQLTGAAFQIVAPSDTDEQKARKIYAAVMKLDNTSFSRTKSEAERKAEKLKPIKDAEDVWKQQSGSDDEIALLFVALGRAAGLTVWPMEVVNRNKAFLDVRSLRAGQLDDYIAILDLSGKELFLDPGERMCPFGDMSWAHTIASGFRLSDKGATLGTTPSEPYSSALVERDADLTVGVDGSVHGILRYVMTGPEALYWRQLALENDVNEVKDQFSNFVRNELPVGIDADFDHFVALDDYNVNLMGFARVKGNIGSAAGRHLILPGLFFEARGKHPFVAQSRRTVSIDVHYPSQEQEEVIYHLPPDLTVESAPQATTLAWPNHAMLKIASVTKNSDVTIVRNFAHLYALLDPKDYKDLHDFYQKIAAADQQQLVLSKPSTAKAN